MWDGTAHKTMYRTYFSSRKRAVKDAINQFHYCDGQEHYWVRETKDFSTIAQKTGLARIVHIRKVPVQ
jgi:hypothetical protein